MTATLPEGMAEVDRSIASMDVGDVGWAFPWAMFHDRERNLWLYGDGKLLPDTIGQMKVWRDEDGWHVDASRCSDYKWCEPGSQGEFKPIAVATFVYRTEAVP